MFQALGSEPFLANCEVGKLVNKKTSESNSLALQAAKRLAKAFLVRNAARLFKFIEHHETWTLTTDCAAENCGLGDSHCDSSVGK